jgi:hypothetical protein
VSTEKTASVYDRFICRREGHIPSVTIKNATVPISNYITTCVRCGKVYEVTGGER